MLSKWWIHSESRLASKQERDATLKWLFAELGYKTMDQKTQDRTAHPVDDFLVWEHKQKTKKGKALDELAETTLVEVMEIEAFW